MQFSDIVFPIICFLIPTWIIPELIFRLGFVKKVKREY